MTTLRPGAHGAAPKTETLGEVVQRRSLENFDLFEKYINPSFAKMLGLVGFGRRFVSASGFEMIDDSGRRYHDFVSGYGTLNIGHNHPHVRQTLHEVLDLQVGSFSQVECGILPGLAAEKLTRELPTGLDKTYFCSSGSEAVDAALKLARAATGRKRIVCCDGAFHGSTLGVLAMTDSPGRRDRFRPLLPGVVRIPFDDTGALEDALKRKDCAAFIVEPILGEGGAVVPDAQYLPRARELCDRYGTLLVLDEVQTGLGRTGAMFACEHWGVVPDAIALAKSLGGGLVPVGAMVCRGRHFERAYGSMTTCLDHKNTFSGGPLAAAALISTLEVLRREELVERARERGDHLKARLVELQAKHDQIESVRGLGLMQGIKFRQVHIPLVGKIIPSGSTQGTADLFAQHVALQLLCEHGIITQVSANDFSVVKVMPPLIVPREAIDHFVDAVDSVLAQGGHVHAMTSMARKLVRPT